MTQPNAAPSDDRTKGFLGAVERLGNLLPDPVMIFVWLIAGLMVLSALATGLGWQASLAYTGETAPPFGDLDKGRLTFTAQSLFSEENIARLLTEMPRTLSGFAPLGQVLVIVYGAAVAERVGLFSALIRASLRDAPRVVLTPLVAVIGMTSHHASDAAYVVFIPLAGLLYAAVGRHPLVGIAAAFAAVSGGFAGNISPGQTDVLLFGFTQEAARIIDPTWTMNPLGNWWFILAIVVVFTPIIWFVTDRVIEPRLGAWAGTADDALKAEVARSGLTDAERRGLRWAGLAALAVVAAFAALALWPGYTPLIDETKSGPAQLQPFYTALIAGFMLLGISPEMTTAAYRMGDSYTNIMTPLMSYFPLVLAFCRRWSPATGVGSLLSMMLPYALCFMAAGIAMTLGWTYFDLPLGPHATVHYTPPAGLLDP